MSEFLFFLDHQNLYSQWLNGLCPRKNLIVAEANIPDALYTAAEAYLSLGYSVIPVWGDFDPTRPKAAGVVWGIYQQRRPTLTEIHEWFFESSFQGLAIVTGRISQLAVLDFDTPEGFGEFSAMHPDLVKNQVIQTRRGYHIYYKLLPHLCLPSRKGQGTDLLSESHYVVARPTCIDSHTYKLIRGGMPKVLTQQDINSINRYFDHLVADTKGYASKSLESAFPFDSWRMEEEQPAARQAVISVSDLQQSYRSKLQKLDRRNEALFQTSLLARDTGWLSDQVLAALADLHARQPAPAGHRQETLGQRYVEAQRTVLSAFSRPSRVSRQPVTTNAAQLPNSVRERLFQLGATKVVRVVEGLRVKGIKTGDTFTTNDALELLKGIVGRDSVYGALKTVIHQPIFSRQNPSPRPPTPAYAASNTTSHPNKCFIGSVEKSGRSQKHRPATVYIMPTNEELCALLGVKRSHSDPLALDDLTTAKKTRMAAHRELIRRRPGHYPRRWLAQRLGVERETLDTYNREIPIQSRACFWEQTISWSNLDIVPDNVTVNGAVLVDESGKRYPARRQIAAILLGQGRAVTYQRQDVNYYWYGAEMTATETNPFIKRYDVQSYQAPTAGCAASHQKPQAQTNHPIPLALPEPLPPEKPSVAAPSLLPDCRKPLPYQEQEALAFRIYETLNNRTGNMKQRLSQMTARRLVATYGVQAVESALKLLSKRSRLERPAGFFVTLLRSESKRSRFGGCPQAD